MTELREKIARELEPQAWAALGTGDTLAYKNRRTSSERKADRILTIPEIAAALTGKAEADEAVRGGGYYLRSNRKLVVSEPSLPDNQS